MSRWDVSRLPTAFEAGNLATHFDSLARAATDPGWKLRYAVSRNAMAAIASGSLVKLTGPHGPEDLLARADELMAQVAAGELKGPAAARRWQELRRLDPA